MADETTELGTEAGVKGAEASFVRSCRDFRWEGVRPKVYKTEGTAFRDIERHTLLGADAWEEEAEGVDGEALRVQTRYFEVAPGGYSSLERHGHTHSVVILRGSGHVVLDNAVRPVQAFDVVYVAPWSLHQFHADRGETLGFLCMVDRERDRPRLPTDEEIDRVVRDPEVRAKIRR